MIIVNCNIGDSFTIIETPTPAGSKLDGPPTFNIDNPAILVLSESGDRCGVVAAAAGIANVTVNGTGGGKAITGDNVVQVTVAVAPPPPPPPATGMAITVTPVVVAGS